MISTVTELAKAKVNLALHVLGRRADGYHDIDSIVAFAAVADVLEVSAMGGQASGIALAVSGRFAAGVPTDDSNLICRAYHAVAAHVPLPPMKVHLGKNLPVAAGIGGGSADAAAALRAFLRLSSLKLPDPLLRDIALALGADVPVCLRQSACRMEGIGEVISDVAALPAPAIVLVNPGVACETAEVFRALGLVKGQRHRSALDPLATLDWRNDLMESALSVQPVIGEVLAALSQQKELFSVRMSGSGATCFGLSRSRSGAEDAAASIARVNPKWWVAASDLD